MSLCICGHAQKEHVSVDRLDNSCQVDECGCSNYATLTEEQQERFAQLGWGGATDTQDSSESDSSTQKTPQEVHQAAEELESEAAEVYERKDKVENERADKADVNSNAQPNDSQAQVMLCVQSAIEKVDKVEADAKKKIDKVETGAKKAKSQIQAETKKAKSHIVQELARNLEGKIPTDEISSEIIHQLHDKVSQRLIHDCLDEKYKKEHRVENARKQKKEHERDLAALNKTVPLKSRIVINTSGKQTVEPVAETRQSDRSTNTGINAQAKHSEFDDNNEETTNTASKKESSAFASKQDEDLMDTNQKVLVSIIPMPFEALQKDLTAVFRTNNGKVGNVFFKVSVDLGKHMAQIECCGITQQKDATMISIGKGEMKEV